MSELSDVYNESYHNSFKQTVEENKKLKQEIEDLRQDNAMLQETGYNDVAVKLQKENNELKNRIKHLENKINAQKYTIKEYNSCIQKISSAVNIFRK